ncbi:MAG TPA: dTDP-4-dehydrorhamnose 3,5-epimerase [Candidatus Saccharimonadales bacterium]|nr:dTDP-4-dehydrorhamnose 3,5-epimerase [Candidatus Saccharimonadales bacterium]
MAVATTEITGHQTDIPGLIWFDVTSVGDERGWFQEKFHKAKLVAAGLPEDFTVVQNSLAYNKRGVTRGFHAEPWDKYVSVVTGKVFVAYVDLREGPTFGKVVTLEVDKNKAVFVPRGVGNSYQCLEDDVYYLYSVNQHWNEDAYKTSLFVNLADPQLNVQWPIPLEQAILSERDKNHPNLANIKPFEA